MTHTDPSRTATTAGSPSGQETGSGLTRRRDLLDFLTAILRVFAEDDDAGKVLSGPIPMRAGLEELSPDIVFVASHHLERLSSSGLTAPADLVVQIAASAEWQRLKSQFEAAGVGEYWLVAPDGYGIETGRRGPDGVYTPLAIEDSGIFRSAVLPLLWIRTEWLAAQPPPLVRTVLIEWGLPRLFAD